MFQARAYAADPNHKFDMKLEGQTLRGDPGSGSGIHCREKGVKGVWRMRQPFAILQYLPEHMMVFQGGPAQAYEIGLTGGQEVFCLISCDDASGKEHRDPGRFFGGLGQFCKITGFRVAGTEKDAQAAGQADAVQAFLLQQFHSLGQFFRPGAAFHVVSASQPQGHRKISRDGGPYSLDHFPEITGTAFQGAAGIGIRPFVGKGRIELVQQVPVGSVDLHSVVAGFPGPEGGRGKGVPHPDQVFFPHGTGQFRLAVGGSGPGRVQDGTGPQRLLSCQGLMGCTACMAQLGQDGDMMLVDGGGDPFQPVQIRPFIKGNLMDTGPAFRSNEAVFLDDQGWPALGHISIIIHKGLGHLALV